MWKISASKALKASFWQPDGTSKPGADWLVSLDDGAREYKLLVRVYADDVVGMTIEQQAAIAMQFVADLAPTGWTPGNYTGKPGELTGRRHLVHSAPRPSL